MTDRRDFIKAGAAFALAGTVVPGFEAFAKGPRPDYDAVDNEMKLVSSDEYRRYFQTGRRGSFAALKRLDDAFDKILREVRTVKVTDPDKPAIWYLYNVGIVVKSVKQTFAIDLVHRRAKELAPYLDFALVTHNHGDHCSLELYREMNKARKVVVSNFLDNYGARYKGRLGGYTRSAKTFKFGDVTVKAALTDHNDYLVDFTTYFEVQIGSFTLAHSGDCSNYKKLRFSRRPDLWVVHPFCEMDVPEACTKMVKAECTVLAHLQELSHHVDKWRWTYAEGQRVVDALAKGGYSSVMPLWGDRVS